MRSEAQSTEARASAPWFLCLDLPIAGKHMDNSAETLLEQDGPDVDFHPGVTPRGALEDRGPWETWQECKTDFLRISKRSMSWFSHPFIVADLRKIEIQSLF